MIYEEILKSLDGYEPSGAIEGFPIEVVARMCLNQYEQARVIKPVLFAINPNRGRSNSGFNWDQTNEGSEFWRNVIIGKDFNHYFEKYTKKQIKRVQVSLMEIADWKECEVDDIEIVN